MTEMPKDLVLIPALFCDEELYADIKPQLAEHMDVHVIAAPRDTMAESVTAILDQAPRTFVLGGTSYGAALAVEVALAAPDRVKGLWLMGNDPAAGDAEQGQGLVQGIETNTDGVIEMLSGLVVQPAHETAAARFKSMANRVGSDTAAKQAKSLATRRSVEDHAGKLTMPVLLIWGEDDKIAPIEKAAVSRKAFRRRHGTRSRDAAIFPRWKNQPTSSRSSRPGWQVARRPEPRLCERHLEHIRRSSNF